MSDVERMSMVDTAWLRMDRPHNLMIINGVWALDRPVDFRRLRRDLARTFAAYPRFHQIPVDGPNGAFWKTDPDFTVDRHLSRAKLPGKAGPAELKRFVASLIPKPLDPDRPWWHWYYIDDYDGGAAIVQRIHHCYADGIALIGVLLGMTETSREGSPAKAARPAKAAIRETHEDEHEPGGFLDFLEPVVASAMKLSGEVLDKSAEIVRDPSHVVDYAKIAARVTNDAAALFLMPPDTTTIFKGKPGVAKRVAWSEPLPLDEVKVVGKALGGSVNDVLLSCAAGALRRYLAARGESTAGVEVRAMVPVNLRRPGSGDELGNKFGLVPLLLPVGIANPIARVAEVRNRMVEFKDSFTPIVALGLLGFMGIAPKVIKEEILTLMASKASAVMTNVPGPTVPLYFAGAQLKQLMFWVPQSGDIGMGVSIFSYNGGVTLGVITDAGLVPDPQTIVEFFRPEFENLLLTVLMEPWDIVRDGEAVERDLARAAARLAKRGEKRKGNGQATPAKRAPAARRGNGAAKPRAPRERAAATPAAAPAAATPAPAAA
ncbi:MAG: wax ester/triacylglycerol synthase family O-acyltransferase [Burkholderiales bacterium]|nr:wax ester/triacylglycerol synthase family O-acyltransferase [Burkholderiales bacterium]